MMNEDYKSILEVIPREDMRKKLVAFASKLDVIESLVQKSDEIQLAQIHSSLSPLDAAKFDWINLYALNALFFAYMKMNGCGVKDHPIMTELARIKSYMKRIEEIKKREDDKLKEHLKIDKESSARIIKRSLWQLASNTNNKNKDHNGWNGDEEQQNNEFKEPSIKHAKR